MSRETSGAGLFMRRHWLLALLILLPYATTSAADRHGNTPDVQSPAPVAKPPMPQPPAESTDRLPPPQITITTRGTTRYKEYRMNGVLYMIEVIPEKGPPYYLIDRRGGGHFSRSNIAPRLSPPMWLIRHF